MKSIATLALATLAGLSAAAAADLPSMKDRYTNETPVSFARQSFAGAYVGASINWDSLNVDHNGELFEEGFGCTRANPQCTTGVVGLPNMSDDAFSGGIRAGYNFRAGSLYFGPVVMFDLGGLEASLRHEFGSTDNEEGPNASLTGGIDYTVNWKGAIAGKLGVAILNERVGIYGLLGAGLVDTDINGHVRLNVTGAGDFTGGGLEKHHNEQTFAWVIGGGIEGKLSDNWTVFAEYNRWELDTVNVSGSVLIDNIRYNHESDSHIDVVRVGVTRYFD